MPILTLAASYDRPTAPLILEASLGHGVTWWETAEEYRGGNEEKGLGAHFRRSPGDRDRAFLVTKSRALDADGLARALSGSLERMNTTRVDFYQLHGVEDPAVLTPELRAWVAHEKAAGRIRLFGFSTHKNVAPLLQATARLDWIDGIMLPYSYRLLKDEATNAAITACSAAGIGLVAMKFRGLPVDGGHAYDASVDRQDDALKLRALWTNPHFASICVHVDSVASLAAHAAAARVEAPPTARELESLQAHADRTRPTYCAGCGFLCEPSAAGAPIADVARFLMYHRSYGDAPRARAEYACLAPERRALVEQADFGPAEGRCPNGVPIARLMREARRLLS